MSKHAARPSVSSAELLASAALLAVVVFAVVVAVVNSHPPALFIGVFPALALAGIAVFIRRSK